MLKQELNKEQANNDKQVIRLNNIHKDYKLRGGYLFKALIDINFSVKEGEVLTIVGHNGAGKSTLIKIIMGLTKLTSGGIKIFDMDVSRMLPKNIKARIGYIPEAVSFYGNLSGFEIMRFFGKLNNIYNKKLFEELLYNAGILKSANKKVITYSKGMRQRLAFAVSRIKNPELYIFDEPTSGMDPSGINEFVSLVKLINNEGKTVILTSHILPEVEDISSRICVMLNGRVAALGNIPELAANLGLTSKINLRFKGGVIPEKNWFDMIKTEQLISDYEIGDGNSTMNLKFLEENRIKLINEVFGKYNNDLADMTMQKPGLFEIYNYFSIKKVSND